MAELDENPLLSTSPPWVFKAALYSDATRRLIELTGQVGLVSEFDGAEAGTLNSLFSLFCDRLGFPKYFGHNWSALKDCLTDLEGLPADAYCFVFRNSDLLLGEDPVERSAFMSTMKMVAEEWATPVAEGEWWDRPAVPFHVVLDLGVYGWDDDLPDASELL